MGSWGSWLAGADQKGGFDILLLRGIAGVDIWDWVDWDSQGVYGTAQGMNMRNALMYRGLLCGDNVMILKVSSGQARLMTANE